MIFPEGLTSNDDMAAFCKAMKALSRPPWLLGNMTEFGKTPQTSAEEWGQFGFSAVLYPISALRVALAATKVRACTEIGGLSQVCKRIFMHHCYEIVLPKAGLTEWQQGRTRINCYGTILRRSGCSQALQDPIQPAKIDGSS